MFRDMIRLILQARSTDFGKQQTDKMAYYRLNEGRAGQLKDIVLTF